MTNEFKKHGINILNTYFCPHSPEENCNCRKPNIGMIEQSLNDFDIDLKNSWLIGDKISDIETAINANIPNKILISKDEIYLKFTYTANNLLDTINIIKE
jgi:D-glycero-D-manno-heptose 1,7-bisphosphate phosphatase